MTTTAKESTMDFKIELVPLAVTDVDRTKAFYEQVGWPADIDNTVHEGLRFVQVTPPGSACSFCFGVGLGMMPQGSTQLIQVVVEDADATLEHLRSRDVECQGVDEQPWGRFVYFADPDGNRWSLQQVIRQQQG
jgi:predicted enzyme related to lactoylglutathione lyase